MHGQECPDAGEQGMAETEHAALPQQNVVTQADDGGDADLAEQAQAQPVAEYPGRDQPCEHKQEPAQAMYNDRTFAIDRGACCW
jgi:hypothetical protein